jgi:hypothetical protein
VVHPQLKVEIGCLKPLSILDLLTQTALALKAPRISCIASAIMVTHSLQTMERMEWEPIEIQFIQFIVGQYGSYQDFFFSEWFEFFIP